MKIDNQTKYDTRFMRKVIVLVHNELAKKEGGRLPRWDRTTFQIRSARQKRGSCGWAYVGGVTSRILVPPPGPTTHQNRMIRRFRDNPSSFNEETMTDMVERWESYRPAVRRFAKVVWHEMMHLYGYRHQHGCDPSIEDMDRVMDKLALDDFYLPLKPEKPAAPKPTTQDKQLAKLESLVEREKAWETKKKRAETYLKKIRKQKRYYERQLKAAGASLEQEVDE